MDATTLSKTRFRRTEEDKLALSKGAIIASIILHIAIVLMGALGLPFLDTRPIAPPVPIIVELVNISDESASPKIAPTPPKVAAKEPPKHDTQEKKPQPKTNKAEALPELIEPTPPKLEEQKPAPQEEEVVENALKPAPEKPKQKPTPPKPEVVKKEKPPEPEKKLEEVKKEEPKPDPFASILKNLADVEDAPTQEAKSASNSQANFPEAVLTRLGASLTLSEQDALRSQLAKCWNPLPGARDAQNLIIEVALNMNPDATVRSAKIVDQGRYNRDSFFKAAADSALRAVRHPYCTPLRLPLDKYSQWRNITVRFDPREMF